jgi:alpha-beta hydrolase superfamily lysophospholipase
MNRQCPLVALLLLMALSGCMPVTYPPGAKNSAAQLSENAFLTDDGASLPMRHWLPSSEPQAILVALHGFNDYSRFFDMPGEYLSKQGIACFAYDQRGFGAAPQHGLWAGSETYNEDLKVFVQLLKQRYPQYPLFLLGESMGGAVIITALGQRPLPDVAGVILSAPALWARSTMPWYQTGLLWTLAHSLPWLTLTGSGVHVMASDNIDMLRDLGRDPLVIKATRVETVYGLSDLMDAAYDSANALRGNTLILYGEKDEIIPKEPTYAFLQQVLEHDSANKTIAIYSQGYHMLLRDLQAVTAWEDIAAWILSGADRLPSGADIRAKELLKAKGAS